ncbi:DNA polymerase Y family protein [Vibrio cholerae]
MTLWLYLHFPSLQLDALFHTPQGEPLVIVDPQRFRVMQLNAAAHAQGIQPGMGLGSASALCPTLQVHPYDADVEHKLLLELAQWLYFVTSDIALYPPNGLLLKVTDMLTLYEGLDKYWQQLSQHLTRWSLDGKETEESDRNAPMYLHYHYATGFSPLCAMLLAKSGTAMIEERQERLHQALLPFALHATELAPSQVDKLARVGITTLEQLLALPMQDIARRFDIDLVNYVGRLMGQFKHPVDFYHPPESFQRYLELLFEIETIAWLTRPLQRLLNQLETFLLLRNQVAYELTLTLHQREGQEAQIHFTSASGDYLATRWMTLCQLTLESMKLDAPVQGLTLKLVRGGELESTSPNLFGKKQGQQSELELISLLQAKLGAQQVRKIALTTDPRPEKSLVLREPERPVPTSLATPKFRPLVLLDNAQPLEENVTLIQGPERIATGWWDGDSITRDYFIARSEVGRWLWVYRTPQRQWFLHGLFC